MNLDTDSDVLSSLANDTGGRFIQRFNNLRPALDAIAGDIASYYVIAYPPDVPADGSYRTIDVSVTRPGLTVRARKGYLAAPHNAASATAGNNVSSGNSPATSAASPAAPRPAASTSTPAPASAASPAADAASAVRLRPGGSDHVSDLPKPLRRAQPRAMPQRPTTSRRKDGRSTEPGTSSMRARTSRRPSQRTRRRCGLCMPSVFRNTR